MPYTVYGNKYNPIGFLPLKKPNGVVGLFDLLIILGQLLDFQNDFLFFLS